MKIWCDILLFTCLYFDKYLVGIVGLDKNNLAKLGEENDKLRQKLSDTQRENIKLKEVGLYLK